VTVITILSKIGGLLNFIFIGIGLILLPT